MAKRHFRPGDWVIYCMSKQGTHPGPRAENIHPNVHGDTCSYTVDKYWLVLGEESDGTVLLATRTGKHRRVSADDPNLRPPRWWERWWYRSRFPRSTGNVQVG
jgi:hypothetical protein